MALRIDSELKTLYNYILQLKNPASEWYISRIRLVKFDIPQQVIRRKSIHARKYIT